MVAAFNINEICDSKALPEGFATPSLNSPESSVSLHRWHSSKLLKVGKSRRFRWKEGMKDVFFCFFQGDLTSPTILFASSNFRFRTNNNTRQRLVNLSATIKREKHRETNTSKGHGVTVSSFQNHFRDLTSDSHTNATRNRILVKVNASSKSKTSQAFLRKILPNSQTFLNIALSRTESSRLDKLRTKDHIIIESTCLFQGAEKETMHCIIN